jgi:argininosuccinate lyase
VVGRLVKAAEERGVSLRDLDGDELRAADASLTPSVLDALDPARAVAARSLTGGPAPDAVRREAACLEAELTALGFEI